MNKKTFKFMLAGVLAVLAFVACDNEEPDNGIDTGYDEERYAAEATISSSDGQFVATDGGGIVEFSAEGGSVKISVNCAIDWIVENTASDIFETSTTFTSLTVIAGQNDSDSEQTGSLTLKTASKGITFATITITQSSKAYINLSAETLSFSVGGGMESVTVGSNYDWEYSYDASAGWFTIVRDGNELKVSAESNDSYSRTSVVTFTAGYGTENNAEAQLTIFQSGIEDMILTYTITSANTTTQLPLFGTVDCTVDWGDGSGIEPITSTLPAHTYSEAGEYDIIINGTVTRLYSYRISTIIAPLPLTAVKQWGRTGLTDMQYAFYYCMNLVSLPEYTGDAFVDVTSFASVFYNCSSLAEIPSGLFENCPNADTFTWAFYNCSSLAEIPSGLFDGCSNVSVFSYVFYGCSSVKTIPASLFNNCTKVTTFSGSFYGCSALAAIPAGLFDGCPEVTVFSNTFYGCKSIVAVPLGLFDNCTEVKAFDGVFYECSALATIPVGLFDNCTKVTDLSYIFYNCPSLKAIPVGLFDNCPRVTTFDCAFYCCADITEIPDGLFDKCSEVTDFTYVFNGCSSVEVIPAGLFDKCPEVTSFYGSFASCSALLEIPTDIFSMNQKVTNFLGTFSNDLALKGESPYDIIDGVKVHLYERSNYPAIYTAPTTTSYCFSGCTGLSDYSSIPSAWGGGGN